MALARGGPHARGGDGARLHRGKGSESGGGRGGLVFWHWPAFLAVAVLPPYLTRS